MRAVRIVSAALLIAAAAGCTTREEPAPAYIPPSASTRVPPERSYLDPGPLPGRGGPGYVRDNLTSTPRQTDSFGNDLLPRSP